ncbi:MAG: hypothetical protein IOC52_12630 [Methylobacterium sp.]|nr:hypothetical protein [Methylobacterium sp.]MCA3625007.1 hypothetical protein [Methylobacterium sp.]
MVPPTEEEARAVFSALSNRLLLNNFPPWSGNPRKPEPVSYSTEAPKNRKPLGWLPLDEWVSGFEQFSPVNQYILSEGPYKYARDYVEHISMFLSMFEHEIELRDIDIINKFIKSLERIQIDLNNLHRFYNYFHDPIVNDEFFGLVLIKRVIDLSSPKPLSGASSAEEFQAHQNRRSEYHASMQRLLGTENWNSTVCLLEMAEEGKALLRAKTQGRPRSIWRDDFVLYCGQLWVNLFSSLPMVQPTGQFVRLVAATWESALDCYAESGQTDGAPLCISPHRLDELYETSWDHTVRDVIKKQKKQNKTKR